MLICVPDVLSKIEVAEFRGVLDDSAWEDGRSTAGAQSALVKCSHDSGRNRGLADPAVCSGNENAGDTQEASSQREAVFR